MSINCDLLLSKLLLLAFVSNLALGAIQQYGYDISKKFNCVALQADAITGSIQYFNAYANRTVNYDFEVDPVSIVSSGDCDHREGLFTIDTILLTFSPKNTQLIKNWVISLRFNENPNYVPKTFASSDYSLSVQFNSSFNSSVASHFYQNDVMPYELQASTPGNGFSCSSTTLKIGANSWLKFTKLNVLSNFQTATQPVFANFAYDKCAADAVLPDGGGVSGWLIVGIILLVLIALAAVGGGVYYFKRVRVNQ